MDFTAPVPAVTRLVFCRCSERKMVWFQDLISLSEEPA